MKDLGSPTGLSGSETELLARSLEALGRFVRVCERPVATGSATGPQIELLAAAGDLADRGDIRLRLSADHTVVALAGATGSGKSSLFNALTRLPISPVGALRPTTAHAHACVWGTEGASPLLDWLGIDPTRRFARESELDGDDEAALRGLVLLDLPDLDSVATEHRLEADRLVGVVDLVVWVLDPQKYADSVLHEGYLRHLGGLRDVTAVVFNQIDRLTPADAARCLADLTQLVEADGLPGIPVLGVSARTGDGVTALRARLTHAVLTRRASLVRLAGELDTMTVRLDALVGTPRADEALMPAVCDEMTTAFAAAAAVPAIGADTADNYLHRAVLPGWPLRRRGRERATARLAPGGDDAVLPVDAALVAAAVRKIADDAVAVAGLPAPWPETMRVTATAAAERVPSELARTFALARAHRPRRGGWWAVRACWWLAVVAAAIGVVWVGWYSIDPSTVRPAAADLPRPWGIALPVLLGCAGVVLALLLLLAHRPIAAARARRLRTRVQRRLRDAAAVVAGETVARLRAVLTEHDAARVALIEAGHAREFRLSHSEPERHATRPGARSVTRPNSGSNKRGITAWPPEAGSEREADGEGTPHPAAPDLDHVPG